MNLISENSIRAAERDRISRELHNSTSQLLVALQLQLGQLRKSGVSVAAEPLLDEIARTLRNIHASVRQIGAGSSIEDEFSAIDNVEIARLFYSLGKDRQQA